MVSERGVPAEVWDSERQVLAWCLNNPSSIPEVRAVMPLSWWSEEAHRDLARVMAAWHEGGGTTSTEPGAVWVEVSYKAEDMGAGYWDLNTVSELGGLYPTYTLRYHIDVIMADARRRRILALLEDGARYLSKSRRDGGRKMVERLVPKLYEVASRGDSSADHFIKRTHGDIDLLTTSLWVEGSGVDVPYSNLNTSFGPLMPGEVWGLSGYSGNGKTQFALNLVRQWSRAGVPAIVFSTEMGARWHLRVAAIEAGLEQRATEKRALMPADRSKLAYALDAMKAWPVVVDTTPNLSPADVVSRTQDMRRAWAGQHVVVVVDHMHRLDYGRGDPNREVGQATKLIKNMAVSDAGGVSVLALYQPRKPDEVGNLYAPVRGHQVRGDYAAYNEVDIHSSVFRVWVETDDLGRTVVNPEGAPKIAKPGAKGARLCSDRTFVLTDKRRIGGEGERPDVLRYDDVTGEIY